VKSQLASMLACLSLAATSHAQPARSLGGAPACELELKPVVDASGVRDSGEPSQTEIDAALARYAHEPSADDVVHAALLVAPALRARALAARARNAAWVPRLMLRVRRGQTVDLSSPQAIDPTTLRLTTNDAIALEAALSFDLERLVFRREEISLLHQSRAEEQARSRLVSEVIHLYFERRKLQLERDLRGDPELTRNVRIAELDALLDAFTNGAFRRMIARASTRWTTAAPTPASTSPSPPKSKSVDKH
jgi:hypothetical protein